METHSVDFNALGLGFNSYVCKAKGKEGGGGVVEKHAVKQQLNQRLRAQTVQSHWRREEVGFMLKGIQASAPWILSW